MAPVTLHKVWMSVQRLPSKDRKELAKMLSGMNSESKEEGMARAARSIDEFFGGWSDDPRTVEEIKADIKDARTTNAFFA